MAKIILFGAPGSGKGTLASRIVEVESNIVHISTGDIFRENISKKTPLGLKAKGFTDKGELVPDELVIDMVRERMEREDVKENGFILDGFPRTLPQAQKLGEFASADVVLLLDVPKDILLKRILGRYSCPNCGQIYNKWLNKPKKEDICDKCGKKMEITQRADDNEETVKRRIEVYEENSAPILKFYEDLGLLKRVDSINTLELSGQEIKRLISPVK
ncbi:MAG: adenylate kinase [Candidatus Lokiarchaeota archaeon]|nr:adenylate kinase [Candidatus Lokiarchaeota archaeon]